MTTPEEMKKLIQELDEAIALGITELPERVIDESLILHTDLVEGTFTEVDE